MTTFFTSSASTYYAKAFLASPLFYQFSKVYAYPTVPDYLAVASVDTKNFQFFTSSRFVLNYLSRKHKTNFFRVIPNSMQNLSFTYRQAVKPYKHFFVPASVAFSARVTPVFLEYYNFNSILFYHSFFRMSVLHNIFYFRLCQQNSMINFSKN